MAEPAAAVGLADLLRALELAAGDEAAQVRYAAILGFAPIIPPRQQPTLTLTIPAKSSPPRGLESTTVAPPSPPDTPQDELFAITSCEGLARDRAAPLRPESVVSALTRDDCRPRRVDPLPFVPLVRTQLLWPAVRRSISDYRDAGIDVPRWVQALARCREGDRLPRRMRWVASDRLHVVWDVADRLTPYRGDYQQLVSLLVRLHGPEKVTLSIVSGSPDDVLAQWHTEGREASITSTPALRGARVLLLTDLGALVTTQGTRHRWQRYARSARAAGADVIAWVPHSARQVDAELAQEVSIHCLDPVTRLRRQLGHLHTRAQRDAEHERLAELREQLLVLGACCVRMEPALLRALRSASPQTATEPGLEGLWWSYQPVVASSHISRPVGVAQQAAYRQRFGELKPDVQVETLKLMRRVHAYQGRSTEMQELGIWGSHAEETARAQVEAYLAEADSWWESFAVSPLAHTPDARDFAREVLRRNWRDEVFQRQYGSWFASLLQLSDGKRIPPGLDSAAVAATLIDDTEVERSYQLFQIGTTLEWLPTSAAIPPMASRLGAPLTLHGIELTDEASGERWRLMPRGQRTVALELAKGHPGCTFIAASHRYAIRPLPRPHWAQEFGRDRFGIYADMQVGTHHGTAIQRFRHIEPGTFSMGSPHTDPMRKDDESPQHTVTLTAGYWLADTACTQELWRALVGHNPSKYRGDRRPVDSVSWVDAMMFLQALSERLPGVEWTLPTEAQWEYACRAGTTTLFSCGSRVTPEQVNYASKHAYVIADIGEVRKQSLPVKSLPPNPWGLYEMHGNVWEWCADGAREYTEQAVTDPVGPSHTDYAYRAGRGGSWYYDDDWARSAARCEMDPASPYKHDWFSFRICVSS